MTVPDVEISPAERADQVGRIDYARADALLEEAMAQEGPDYVYVRLGQVPSIPSSPRCVNFDPVTGKPSCLIGRCLALLGFTPQTMTEGPISSAVNSGLIHMDNDAHDLWRFAQNAQDQGSAWGVAVKWAREQVERNRETGCYDDNDDKRCNHPGGGTCCTHAPNPCGD